MSWVDITVIVVPLVLAGTVALLLIRTMVRSRQQSKPKASSQVSRPKRSTADQSPPVRRDPPSMHSFTPEVKASQTTDEDLVFGQAGRDRMSSPPSSAAPSSDAISSPAPSPPPSSVETFWSDFKGERSAKFISFINFKGGVGKSTCAAELSAALASQNGKRVLLIDLDPQTNATFYFMDYSQWEHWQQTAGSLRTLFDAFLAGYREVREFSDRWVEELPRFARMKNLGFYWWDSVNSSADRPDFDEWIAGIRARIGATQLRLGTRNKIS